MTRAVSNGRSRAGLVLLVAVTAFPVGAGLRVAGATSPLGGARAAVDRLAGAGGWPPEQAKPVLDVLEQQTRRLLAMPRDKDAIRLGEQLLPLLTRVYEGLSGRTDAMRQDVLERDGDIEEFMATPAYRERETLALTALYHLSWARYQVSQLVQANGPDREELLRGAIRGFTEFVYVNEVPEIYGDCLYGRALAFLALGDTKKATDDLEEVVGLGRGNRAYARARAALEAIRHGKPIEPPPPADRTTAELERLAALLDSKAPPGKKRSEQQEEALALARALASRDEPTAERVKRLVRGYGPAGASFASFVLAEIASDRGNHREARDHYTRAAAATDRDAATFRSRSRLGIAEASYRLGEHERAEKEFARFLSGSPGAAEAERALYFRFKAIEGLMAETEKKEGGTAGGKAGEALLEAERAYLDRFPDGDHAAEVRYRLGEAHQARGDCARALEAIGNPGTKDAWSLRARFIALQCQADQVSAAWSDGSKDGAEHYRRTLESAREIALAVAGSDDVALQRLGAKASLLGALLARAAPTPRPEDVAAILADFEQRFPWATDLMGDVLALRALARTRLGNTEGARADIDGLSRLEGDALTLRQQLHHVGHELMREAARSDPDRRQAILSVAQRVYTALVGPAGKGSVGREEGGGSHPLISDLANLGQIALELGDADGASRAYRRLLDLDPDSLEARRGIALTAEKRGQQRDALRYWRRVEELTEPGETLWYEARLHGARMEGLLGKGARACAALRETAARAGPPSAEELALAFVELERQVCRR